MFGGPRKQTIVDRIPTRGGAAVLVERHPGRWWRRRRYTWQCQGCRRPTHSRARYSRRLAARRAHSHASKCWEGPPGTIPACDEEAERHG